MLQRGFLNYGMFVVGLGFELGFCMYSFLVVLSSVVSCLEVRLPELFCAVLCTEVVHSHKHT